MINMKYMFNVKKEFISLSKEVERKFKKNKIVKRDIKKAIKSVRK